MPWGKIKKACRRTAHRLKLLYETQVLGKTEVLVLGDSHTDVFSLPRFRKYFPRHFFSVTTVGGATASGLENPNSKTQAYRIFREAIRNSDARLAIIQLGEVDTGFVIWYRARKYNADVSDMTRRAVDTLTRFISEVAKTHAPVVISAPLPTIGDEVEWGEVAKARSKVKATQRERTALTLEFNREITAFCTAHDYPYLSLDEECMGEDGLVSPAVLNPDIRNHHYDLDIYAGLLYRKLQPVLGLAETP
jgi:hypothetical protein